MQSRNHIAALAYADQCGLPVFPLAPKSKRPLCAHGENDGTTDLKRIDEWWREAPSAGIGCALRFTPWFVLDVDARAGGDEWLAAQLGLDALPTPLICETGSGWPSAHYWFRRSPRLMQINAKSVAHANGVDLKGLPYGYVILPPTVHQNTGREYAWWDGCEPLNIEPALPPRWLEDRILGTATPLDHCRLPALDMGLSFPRAIELIEDGWTIGEQVGVGKWIVACPNAAQHTGKAGRRDSSTVLFAPSRPGGWGRIWCSHAHCSGVR